MASEPPVLLVHGLATSAERTWREPGWIDLLSESGREVLAVDLLGHGSSPKPHDPAAYAQLEAHLAAQLPDGPVDAIGFSLGARTVLALAVEDPSRFGRIVLAGVGRNLFERDEARGRAIAESLAGKDDPDDREAAYFGRLADSPEVDREALVALLSRPEPAPFTDEGLARVTNEVLVVIGDRDFAGPADPLVERLPNARLKVLRNVDHFATPNDFGFIDAALGFLGASPV
ncbi:MAG: alpha/beta fold hydrolase [Actinomycetota bacterium]|nr:alpha/beta fold hydrolase [Actinomycetota bacterium]